MSQPVRRHGLGELGHQARAQVVPCQQGPDMAARDRIGARVPRGSPHQPRPRDAVRPRGVPAGSLRVWNRYTP